MTAETEPSPAHDPEELPKTSSAPLWLIVLAVLVLGGVVEVIIYGYLERPGWIGSSGKQFWDYLELLIVPAVLAIGVAWLNWAQRKREREAEEAQQERADKAEEDRRKHELEAQAAQRQRELEVENQRAQDAALLAYLDKMDDMLLRLRESSNVNAEVLADTRTLIRARTLSIVESLDRGRKGALMRFLSESGLLKKECPTTISLRDADFGSSDP